MALRQLPGQQEVEERPERVHVRRGRDLLAEQLLRRREGRRQRKDAGRPRLVGLAVGEHLGDAEVEELHLAGVRDEHVRRLDVAVHDEAAVRRVHRVAQREREPDHVPRRGAATVLGDRDALHALHHEVRPSVGGGPRVEEARDVRVVELAEHATLAQEAAHHTDGVEPALEDLDRDVRLVSVVGARRRVDLAHAAGPDPRADTPRPETLTRLERARLLVAGHDRDGVGQEAAGAFHGRDHRRDLRPHRAARRGPRLDVRHPLALGSLERLGEQGLDLRPLLAGESHRLLRGLAAARSPAGNAGSGR